LGEKARMRVDVKNQFSNLPHPTLSPRRGLSCSRIFEKSRRWICRTVIRKNEKQPVAIPSPRGEGQDEGIPIQIIFIRRTLRFC
jgi:hypothetical protein